MTELRQRVLSDKQLEDFAEQGYILISDCISEADRKQLVEDMWKLSALDKRKPETWDSTPTPLRRNGFLEMYHNPIQWKVRQDPRLYNIFADIFQNDELWVSIDRVNMKMPSKGNWTCRGFTHWDFDPWNPEEYPLQLQGVIALEDTSIEMGGFHCVAGMHRTLREWTATRPIGETFREKFYENCIPIVVPKRFYSSIEKQDKVIPMKAGEMIIWRGELAHGNGENRSSIPRMAMYLTMFPADETQYSWIAKNIEIYQHKLPGVQSPYPQLGWGTNKPRPFVKDNYFEDPPVELLELGKKLVGLDTWQ